MMRPIKKAKSLFMQRIAKEPAKTEVKRTEAAVGQHKSKLMLCIEILCALVRGGPMKLSQLRDKVGLDIERLKPHMRLLWNRGLIEEETFGDETYFVVTERGQRVLMVIGPIVKEAHKLQVRDLESISSALSEAGYL